MKFAQFYKKSTGYVAGSIPPKFDPAHVKPIEALGSDGVTVMDGRFSLNTQHMVAKEICRQRGFLGYTLHEGASFSVNRKVSEYKEVSA